MNTFIKIVDIESLREFLIHLQNPCLNGFANKKIEVLSFLKRPQNWYKMVRW